jgi:prepilin-type N-terminal cleavage/methylation domain-containing protein
VNPNLQRIRDDASGFTLVEVMIAAVILVIGLISLAYGYAMALSVVSRAQEDTIARQKAREAMEDVFTARDTQTITFAQICNIAAGTPCIFTVGATPLYTAGPDEIVNTADDGTGTLPPGCSIAPCVETVDLPGPDGILGTADDVLAPLYQYQRQITIVQINPLLKQVTVTITYTTSQGQKGSVTINALMSPYV